MIKVSKEDIKLFREEKNSFNQSQIQPCLNAYLITSIPPPPPSFLIKVRGKILLNGGIWTLVWNIEKYMKEEPCIPSWIPRTIMPENGAEWIEVLVVVVVEKIPSSPVKLLSHTTEYNKIWVTSVLLILSSNLTGSVGSHRATSHPTLFTSTNNR